MIISVDGVELFEIDMNEQKVIQDQVMSSIFDADMKRRLEWILTHLYDQCFLGLMNQWVPILRTRVESLPTDKVVFANLVFSQPDYKDAQQRHDEQFPS